MSRHESFRALATAGLERQADTDLMAPFAGSWEEMARAHCAGRNEKVAVVIGYCLVIRHRHPVHATGSFVGAQWQLAREIESKYEVPPEWAQRLQAAKLSDEERGRLTRKFTSMEDAHRVPCEIRLGGRPLERFLQDPLQPHSAADPLLHASTLRGTFGAVDRLPKMFNECDSHAESANLRRALLAACTTLAPAQGGMSEGAFRELHHTAYQTWLAEADVGIERAISFNEQKRDSAPEGSYERLYRELKLSVLQDYRRFTASEIPVLGAGGALTYFDDYL